MGFLYSKLAKPKEDDYEKILSDLEEQIRQLELAIFEANLRVRRLVALWTTYSILVYFIWLASFFFIQWPYMQHSNGLLPVIKAVAPVILSPAFIYFVRVSIQLYYKRYISARELELDGSRKKQRVKVEEMKRNMKYYQAKNLIERYDAPKKASTPVKEQPQRRLSAPKMQQSVQQLQLQGKPSPARAQTQQQLSLQLNSPPRLQYMPPQYQSPPQYSQQERSWVDRLLDIVIGEDGGSGSQSKYALICSKCYTHNGLAAPGDIPTIQYTCPKCGHFNSKLQANGSVSPVTNSERSDLEQRISSPVPSEAHSAPAESQISTLSALVDAESSKSTAVAESSVTQRKKSKEQD